MAYQNSYGDAGIGLQLGAGLGKGYAAWQSGKTNQLIDDFNASIEDQKATATVNQGQFQVNKAGQRLTQVLGAQSAGFAANGVVVGAGTSADVAKSTSNIGLADMAMIRANAAMKAWGYNQLAASDRLRGSLAEESGKSEAIGDTVGAVGQAAGGMYRMSN